MDKVTIGGNTYVIHRLKPRVALRLDKTIMELVMSAAGGLGGSVSDWRNLDAGVLFDGISRALRSLSSDQFVAVLTELFGCVQVSRPGRAPEQIDDDTFDSALQGVPIVDLYTLAFEVMKRNHFSPFALAEKLGIGNLTSTIRTSAADETSRDDGANGSATSATSRGA